MPYDNTRARRMQEKPILKLLGGMLFLLAYVIIHPTREKVPKKHNFFNVPQDKRKKDPDRVSTSIPLAQLLFVAKNLSLC